MGPYQPPNSHDFMEIRIMGKGEEGRKISPVGSDVTSPGHCFMHLWAGRRRLSRGSPAARSSLSALPTYLHSARKLSAWVVTSPSALMVTWEFSWIRKLFPVPWPMMRKLFT
jgi:hypothetical protein